jgi:predicted TIM-barrel fold metal-dependent hydrolase
MIDCHTHWGRPWRERDGDDPTRWLAILDEFNMSHAVVLPEVGLIHAGKLADDNTAIATVCAKSQGKMLPFCTVNAWYREEALVELEHCLGALQFRGVKFHNWLQGFSIGHPVIDEVCEMAAAYGVPILFHDGTPPFSLPSQIALLARRHPSTQIILGHCGLFEHWREAAEALRSTANLWGCICGPHTAGIKHLVERCDTTRLVWGSDQGYTLADCYPYRLHIMDTLNLSSSLRAAIFETNAAHLLNLKAAASNR